MTFLATRWPCCQAKIALGLAAQAGCELECPRCKVTCRVAVVGDRKVLRPAVTL